MADEQPKTISEVRSDYYVYVLFRETGIPFYVGKGRGNRWLDHERRSNRGKTHKDNVVRKMQALGLEIPKVKIAVDLTNEQASNIEIAFIKAIGREPHGPLVNATDGGEGHEHTEGTRSIIAAKRKRQKPSDEGRAKQSATMTGRKYSDEHRANMSRAKMRENLSAETLAKRSAALTGQKRTREQRDRMRAGRLRYLRSQGRIPDYEAISTSGDRFLQGVP